MPASVSIFLYAVSAALLAALSLAFNSIAPKALTAWASVFTLAISSFEAKSTNLKSLPFKNISKHQIEHLNKVVSHGGIAFFIVNFRTLKETYFLPFEELQQFLQTTNRKSISVNTIKKKGQLIKGTIFIPINYVECLDLYLSKNEKIL